MPESTNTIGHRPHESRVGLRVGIGVSAFFLFAITGWAARLDSAPLWVGGTFTLVAVLSFAAILLLTRFWSDRRALLGAVGFALVAIGSGFGRPRIELYTGTGGGDVIGRLDTWVPFIAVGLAVSFAALIWALATAQDNRSTILLAPGSLLSASLGYIATSFLLRDLVIGSWIAGRPIRRGPSTPRCRTHTNNGATTGHLWYDSAIDEAAAVTAFSDLAERLKRVGAPSDLVRRCRLAAREEERHVKVCERIAAGLGGDLPTHHESPSPVPQGAFPHPSPRPFGRSGEVARLALESFIDGVVGEGFAAQRLRAGSETTSRAHRAMISSIAVDEEHHAVLGADITRWACREYPTLVGAALRSAARRLPDSTELPESHRKFGKAELRKVGLVDADRACVLWSRQRADALHWLDQLLSPRVDQKRGSSSKGAPHDSTPASMTAWD